MTYGPPPQQPPTAEQPAGRRRASWKVVGGITAGLVALCCGGVVGLGAMLDDPDRRKASAGAVTGTLPVATPEATPPAKVTRSAQPVAVDSSPTPATARPATGKPRRTRSATPAPATSRPATSKPATPRPATPRPTTPKPTTPEPEPTTPELKTVTPGAFCAPEGAMGVSKKGKLYRCTKKAGEKQARWRAA